jgi:hypothetical protein
MPATLVNLNPGGGRPAVEIIVGNGHFARFDFSLFDATGSNPQLIGEGLNVDNIPDIFPLPGPTISALDQTTIFWRAVISSPTGLPNETFAVTVRVIQDGKVMGSDSKTGLVTDIPPKGFIRLQVS